MLPAPEAHYAWAPSAITAVHQTQVLAGTDLRVPLPVSGRLQLEQLCIAAVLRNELLVRA